MQAIILAGGFGTRLKSIVSNVPKPLAMIGEKPFIGWLVSLLEKKGFSSVTLSLHYDWEKIKDYFDKNSPAIKINYAVEKKPLGTGGAIIYSLNQINEQEPVLVLNGDSFTKINYSSLYNHHQLNKSQLTMTLREVQDSGRYGRVITENGIITSFASGINNQPAMINAGIYVINKELFDGYKMNEAFSFEQDFLPKYLQEIKPNSFLSDGYFIDIGIPEDYLRACIELPKIFTSSY
jgi:D-glycero-alpha-D-manno-heptose 1-phosphate guanylyltransferase